MMPGGKILLMCCNGLLVMTGAYQAGGLAAGVLEQRIIEQEAAPLILPAVATETNTRPQASADYTEFAADGLTYALPLIEILRTQLWTQPTYKPNILGDMLRTIVKVREWNPQRDGVLRIAAKDLQNALPAMPKVLKELSKKKTLVRYYRPMLPDGRQFSTNVYEFDSRALAELYRS